MILFLVLTIQKKKGQNSKCTSHTHMPQYLELNLVVLIQIKLSCILDTKSTMDVVCTWSVHISSSQALYNKNPIISSLYGKSPEQPKFGLDFVEAIPNFFCIFQDFHLLCIVREKNICNADNSSFASLFDTHLTGPGRSVFYIFQGGTGCWNNYHILSIWTKSMTPVVESFKKRPTNHGWELRSFKTKLT